MLLKEVYPNRDRDSDRDRDLYFEYSNLTDTINIWISKMLPTFESYRLDVAKNIYRDRDRDRDYDRDRDRDLYSEYFELTDTMHIWTLEKLTSIFESYRCYQYLNLTQVINI